MRRIRLVVLHATALAIAVRAAPQLEAQATAARPPDVVCASKPGERQSCAANTLEGVTLVRSTGNVACDLGHTWGYDQATIWVRDGCSATFALGDEGKGAFGTYTPMKGFRVASTDHGDLSIKLTTYVRYLNQLGLDPTYVDAFGATVPVGRRQDIQLQKVQISLLGWVLSPKFRYLAYAWSSNVNMGLGAQVVLGGNLTYAVDRHLTVGGGINALPGVRTTEGNFPLWLPVDNRLIADEFFRPSYTTGIWAKGDILDRLSYNVMLGNNLSQLGVDAGQLDNSLNTVAAALVWLPTTGEFGPLGGYGDFEHHDTAAVRLGAHYTYSIEDYQGQPTNDNFENVQIRISNGGVVFTPDLFGPGIWVQDARYRMSAVDAGLKFRGLSLDVEHYWRWVDQFQGPGTAGLAPLYDHGFQALASAMVLPKSVQVYAGGSKVFGEYGNPSDLKLGVNWFPWHNQVVKWNLEYLHLTHSPVGGLSLPYPVGGNGPVFYTSFLLAF